MEQRTSSPYPGKDRPVLAAIGVLLVVSTVVFAVTDHRKDWRWYQAEFRKMVAEKLGEEKAATVPAGMKQIWVKDLGRADQNHEESRDDPGRQPGLGAVGKTRPGVHRESLQSSSNFSV